MICCRKYIYSRYIQTTYITGLLQVEEIMHDGVEGEQTEALGEEEEEDGVGEACLQNSRPSAENGIITRKLRNTSNRIS